MSFRMQEVWLTFLVAIQVSRSIQGMFARLNHGDGVPRPTRTPFCTPSSAKLVPIAKDFNSEEEPVLDASWSDQSLLRNGPCEEASFVVVMTCPALSPGQKLIRHQFYSIVYNSSFYEFNIGTCRKFSSDC